MTVGFCISRNASAATVDLFEPRGAAGYPLATVNEGDDLTLAFLGRLYFRDDLCARIGAAPADFPEDDPAALAAAAYRKLGTAGLEALEGDFALALVDRTNGRLIAQCDPVGGYPLYWTQTGSTVAVATGLRPLADIVPKLAVDIDFLGETLMLTFAEIDYFERSAYTGIGRVVPGTRLVADFAGGAARIERWWDWRDRIETPKSDRLEDVAEHYLELLSRSAAERARGTVAAHLSGGMDSTSAAYLARDSLATRGDELHTISLVYEKLTALAKETRFVEAAEAGPGLIPHRIPADGILDFDHFEEPPLHDEPATGFFRGGIDVALTDAAVACGANTSLTGLGADEFLADAPLYLADLLRTGRLGRAWSEAVRFTGVRNTSTWRFFREFAIEPLLPPWLRGGLGAMLRGGRASWEKQNHFTIAPWVLPAFAEQAHLRARALDMARQNFRAEKSVVLSEILARARYSTGDWTRTALAAPHNLHVAHPFRDQRLMAFSMGVRLKFPPDPTKQKAVLGAAMRGRLPDVIVDRPGKGDFNAVYFRGIARNAPYLEAMIKASNVEEIGLFDKAKLLDCLRLTAMASQQIPGVVGLNNTLAIIRWLSLIPRWRAAPSAPTRRLEVALDRG